MIKKQEVKEKVEKPFLTKEFWEIAAIKDVRKLISAGVDMNALDKHGREILSLAVWHSPHNEVLELLLDSGAMARGAKDSNRPLHAAAFTGDVSKGKLLLDCGANIEGKTNVGFTPLHSAAYFGQLDFVKFLVAEGAKICASPGGDCSHWTPCHEARAGAVGGKNGCEEVVEYLAALTGEGAHPIFLVTEES